MIRIINSTNLQCIAGIRSRRGIGPVVVLIDNSITESIENFEYVDDPEVFSLKNSEIIRR